MGGVVGGGMGGVGIEKLFAFTKWMCEGVGGSVCR